MYYEPLKQQLIAVIDLVVVCKLSLPLKTEPSVTKLNVRASQVGVHTLRVHSLRDISSDRSDNRHFQTYHFVSVKVKF